MYHALLLVECVRSHHSSLFPVAPVETDNDDSNIATADEVPPPVTNETLAAEQNSLSDWALPLADEPLGETAETIVWYYRNLQELNYTSKEELQAEYGVFWATVADPNGNFSDVLKAASEDPDGEVSEEASVPPPTSTGNDSNSTNSVGASSALRSLSTSPDGRKWSRSGKSLNRFVRRRIAHTLGTPTDAEGSVFL